MAWQETPFPPNAHLDADTEREYRLVAQARSGADWALAALIARYQPAVVRYLIRLTGDNLQARALAERIFRRMDRRIRGPHAGEHLRLWLLRACTEAGLDALRHPAQAGARPLVGAPNPAGLLAERVNSQAQRLRAGIERLAERTDSTRRQVRQLIWSTAPQPAIAPQRERRPSQPIGASSAQTEPSPIDPDLDSLDPREALRHRMMRAVLAELPYGDAQCLALHLIAGLNQAEVARALGIRPSAARHRIVVGLERFSQRYESALEELGVSRSFGYGATASLQGMPDMADMPDMPNLAEEAAAAGEMDEMDAMDAVDTMDAREPEAAPYGTLDDSADDTVDDSLVARDTSPTRAESAHDMGRDVFGTPIPVIPARPRPEARAAESALAVPPRAPVTVPLEPGADEPGVNESPVHVIATPPLGLIVDAVAVASPVTLVEEQAPSDEHELALEPSAMPWAQPPADVGHNNHNNHNNHRDEAATSAFVVESAPPSQEADGAHGTNTAGHGETPAVVPVRSHPRAASPQDLGPTREVPVRSPVRPRTN